MPRPALPRRLPARLCAAAVVVLAKAVTAVRADWRGAEPLPVQRVYFANHCSNADMPMIWAALPSALRARTRPVAAADYWLRTRLRALLPGHVETLSYAMPGFRQPGAKGRMVVGYAAFARHLGLYPHSGSVIPKIDCTPFKTSKSGVLFTPDHPLRDALLKAVIDTRQAELAADNGRRG